MLETAQKIIDFVIAENMPQSAVKKALSDYHFDKSKTYHIMAIGKAAWTMAIAAVDFFCENLQDISLKIAVVVTKHGHTSAVADADWEQLQNALKNGKNPPKIHQKVHHFEAGHPISDDQTIIATEYCINLAENLTENDELIFLLSGGGSALFEKPLPGVSLADIQDISAQLLASGANIVEINVIRKRLSSVKAGRFAQLVAPAKIFAIVLSDVLGDRLDSIASGPTAADTATTEQALYILDKYGIKIKPQHLAYISQATPANITNVQTSIVGSVNTLCKAAAEISQKMGYTPYILTTSLDCEAAEAGRFLGKIASDTHFSRNSFVKPCVIIAGGETVVTIKGNGKGGRNQELALSAAKPIENLPNTLIFSLGSDGTDGPTDAAGGIVTGETIAKLAAANLNIDKILANNDSYTALKEVNGLIVTNPTGTNVNDLSVAICG
ncbi:MAG: glycerate kinase [Defluviitaleaceae bacterium]|nr:glycerate kinase [Defluviitaleaceae bacterium]